MAVISYSLSGKMFIQMLCSPLVIVNDYHYLPGFFHPGAVLMVTSSYHYMWLPSRIKVLTVLG